MICSKSKIDDKIKFIFMTLINIVQTVINNKIMNFNKIKLVSVQRCPVYLHLPWLEGVRDRLSKQLSSCKKYCYFSADVRLASKRSILTSICKDDLLTIIIVL